MGSDSHEREQLKQDLGLGGKFSERSRVRILNRNGEFNIRRNSLSRFHPYNAYNTFLSLSVPQLILLMAGGYFATNLAFACFYWLAGPGALLGASIDAAPRFADCFFFSVQTIATIGYGKITPSTPAANFLVAIEALIGLLGFAVLSALLFARFVRPTAKIRFSTNALIAPYEDGWALMFRLANLRNHDLTDVHAIVSFARWAEWKGGRRRRFDQLSLERESIIFMPLHWVIVHPITESSPLHGFTPESLAAAEPEFVCLITADDETFAQTVHAKTSYDKSDLVWGARFRDMYIPDPEKVAVDLNRLHDFEKLDGPASL